MRMPAVMEGGGRGQGSAGWKGVVGEVWEGGWQVGRKTAGIVSVQRNGNMTERERERDSLGNAIASTRRIGNRILK